MTILEYSFLILLWGIMFLSSIILMVLIGGLLYEGVLASIDFVTRRCKKGQEFNSQNSINFRRIIEMIEVGQDYEHIVELFNTYKYQNKIINMNKLYNEEKLSVVYEVNDDTYCPRVYLHFNNGKLTRLSTEKL